MKELLNAANAFAFDLDAGDLNTNRDTFIEGAQWQKEHLWKDAEGNDLPEYDREVVVLCDDNHGGYKVCFGHRIEEGATITSSIDGQVYQMERLRHGIGGWNIPDVKWWLDLTLPYEGKEDKK